ncbi:MAG: hypothetical protein LBQ74_13010 [Prevotella sp.]|jgi:chromosome segregation ATPase|nr:hypothetical protein [Prevotella sp.]
MNNVNKYIKVTDNNGKSSVVPAGNEDFFKAQKYKIGKPTDEEIEAFFPTVKKAASGVKTTYISELGKAQEELGRAQTALIEERAEHVATRNQLISEQDEHKKTKDALTSLDSEYKKAQTALSEATVTIEKLNAELGKLKTGK